MWKNPKVWSLAIAETITWAGIFYLFPAMLMHWETYFGWSRVELTFGFTGALIISAGTGIFAGRLIDRGHGRTLMTVSAFTGGLLIAMLPLLQHLWQFYLIWLLIGFTMAGCLYEPCFAFLTHVYYPKSKRPIIIVTLVAGFAGTLCFPLSSVITNYIHWQAAVWVFSVLVCGFAVPLFWYGASTTPAQKHSSPTTRPAPLTTIVTPLLRSPTFWCLVVAFACFSLNHSMIISHILPLLDSQGVSANYAVIAAASIGVAQVLGRLVLITVERRLSMLLICMCSFIGLSLASVNLAFAGTATIILCLFVCLQGGSAGIGSIAKPTVTADLLGSTNFGAISAMVSIAHMLGFAFGPALSGLIWSVTDYDTVIKVTGTLALIGVFSLFIAQKPSRN
jgi:MFS family permease